ncbi:MAG: hypothetical protein H7833_04335 [Magnetococcus sp. DMHC-1]|nr:hypothetical protein [Magnetococcales bacterium]
MKPIDFFVKINLGHISAANHGCHDWLHLGLSATLLQNISQIRKSSLVHRGNTMNTAEHIHAEVTSMPEELADH